ncbi:hypothetical protein IJH02_02965, partial [Candidatus Saccharibacteria bacterium]|nr:hypothetical protein [Candidatus Saccharibacteria bacterium]
MNYQNVNNINKKSAVLAHRQIPLKSGSSFYLPVLAFVVGGTLILSLVFSSLVFFSSVSATSASGAVQLNAEVATAIAMKIASPNDTNPDCMEQSGVTYGVANRYA